MTAVYARGLPRTYHCQDPSKDPGWSLCGMDVVNNRVGGIHTFDYVEDFRPEGGDSQSAIREIRELVPCKKCLSHPDMPMILLGRLP